jgi:hypothetical protein
MKKSEIRKAISNRKAAIAKKHVADIEHFQKQLFAIVTRDVREFYDPNTGKLLRPEQLPELAALTVEGVRECTKCDKEGNETTTFEYKFAPKIPALDLLAKHKGLLQAQEHNVNVKGKVQIDYEKLYTPPDKQKTIEVNPVDYMISNPTVMTMPRLENREVAGEQLVDLAAAEYGVDELIDLPDDGD